MTLFFNLDLLEAESGCDPSLMLSMLEYHYRGKTVPKNARDKILKYRNLSGYSFLLDAQSLFKDTSDIIYKSQYVRLAGRRDYNQYKLYNLTHLDLSYFKDINLDSIKYNPLLTIQNNTINFKYESK